MLIRSIYCTCGGIKVVVSEALDGGSTTITVLRHIADHMQWLYITTPSRGGEEMKYDD